MNSHRSVSLILIFIAAMVSACSQPTGGASSGAPAAAKQHIENIDGLSYEELTRYDLECGRFNSSPALMAQNPYTQADCDRVQKRHAEWRSPQSVKPASPLPGLH